MKKGEVVHERVDSGPVFCCQRNLYVWIFYQQLSTANPPNNKYQSEVSSQVNISISSQKKTTDFPPGNSAYPSNPGKKSSQSPDHGKGLQLMKISEPFPAAHQILPPLLLMEDIRRSPVEGLVVYPESKGTPPMLPPQEIRP